MSALTDSIGDLASAKAGEFLCSQIIKNREFTRKAVPDPLGTYKLLVDFQTAILQGMLKCPDEFDEDKVLGKGPQFEGGQCPIRYDVTYSFNGGNTGIGNGTNTATFLLGPIGPGVRRSVPGNPNQVEIGFTYQGGTQFFQISVSSDTSADFSCTVDGVTTSQGLPDNCGSMPGTPGQIDGDYEDLPELPIEETTINYDFSFDYGGDIGQVDINMPFSNFRVDELIPFQFSFDVGGQRFVTDDTGTEPEPSADTDKKDKPARDKETADLLKKLNEELEAIKECVCEDGSDIELETANLPIAICSGPEGSKSAEKVFRSLQVLKDSVSASLISEFDQSAELGIEGCVCDNSIEQMNAMEIFSGVVTEPTAVIYSPELDLEVRSVVLVINSYDRAHTRIYRLAGEEVEGDFGWMAVSANQFSSGGHVTRLVSKETYIRLPHATKPLRVRLSLRRGTDYTLWDTGERGSLRLPGAA